MLLRQIKHKAIYRLTDHSDSSARKNKGVLSAPGLEG
jgi:hypothetical protein